MTPHQYSPQEALKVLMLKLESKNAEFAKLIQGAIDAGKDRWEETKGKNKRHAYRKTVPFSHEEALQIAIDALQAYFVEQPLFVDATLADFTKAAIGVPKYRARSWSTSTKEREPVSVEKEGESKRIEIELQIETQIAKIGAATMLLSSVATEELEERKYYLEKLRELTYFRKA